MYVPQPAVEPVAAGSRVLGAEDKKLVSGCLAIGTGVVPFTDAGDAAPVVERLPYGTGS